MKPSSQQLNDACVAVVLGGQDFSFGKPDESDFIRMICKAIGRPEPENIEELAEVIYEDMGETLTGPTELVMFVCENLPEETVSRET